MNLDKARELANEALPNDADFTVEQEECDLLLVIRNITISYAELASLALAFGTTDIKLENTTCEQSYYGDHKEGQTTLRVHAVLDELPIKITQPEPQLCCSFCGKAQRQVKKLIAGPIVYICDECVKLCQAIIEEGK